MRIPCSIRKDIHIDLELPYTLSLEFDNYLDEREGISSTYLFTTKTGSKIQFGFIFDLLKKIRLSYLNIYESNDLNNNPFTPTGLQKYAIKKMIEAGMNQSIIIDFTGQSQDIFNDCQDDVNNEKKLNRNRYINHMIRGIATYDKINNL